ncbi:MAG: hypothetical protein ACRET0_01665 [Steroidobacteraceae bacterium]
MRSSVFVLAAAVALTSCASGPPPSTARLPGGAFGSNGDNDIAAINTASWAFANPARTHGNSVNAIRAVLAIEYLAGELSSNPRWDFMSSLTKLEMLDARRELRAKLGIAEDAPSQAVANALLALSHEPTPAAAAELLKSPLFTLGPSATLARIENLPYLPAANLASLHASQQEFPGGGSSCVVCG